MFDECADRYEEELARGLSVTGEDMQWYARERLKWVRQQLGGSAARVLDFGCGVGHTTPEFFAFLGAQDLVGVDPSARSLALATERYGSAHARFMTPDRAPAEGPFDLAYCNGVFHHVPPAERLAMVRLVYESLRPGGVFAFWENNPWNPGTRYIMSRVSFDRDAITISPPQARRLLVAGGFVAGATTSRFLFPRALAALRPIERVFVRLPIGGQYLVWCHRPTAAPAAGSSSKSSPGSSAPRARSA